MQVSQIWQTGGGRKTVTKANNRKHKTQNSQDARCGTLFSWENKTQAKASLAADNRSPCHCTSQSATLCVVLSPTDCSLVIDPKKIEKSCSNAFSGLSFQVLRTQRSSVNITLSVFKQRSKK